MKTDSIVVKILMVIGFFVVASVALRILGVAFSIFAGLFFKIVVPLAIAYFIVKWLTDRRNNKVRRRY